MKSRLFTAIFGPRVPAQESAARRSRYAIPTVLLCIAAALLVASFTQTWWRMTLHAPQYPKGLHVQAYLNRLEGDVREIDNLNHYIGMRPLNEAAQLERKSSLLLIIALGSLVLGASAIHSRWSVIVVAPAFLFPAGFLIDLHLWLHHFGQNLDPTAALSSSVRPFTPPVLGEGVVGNFRTTAAVDVGWWMAVAASAVILAALWFHRRAYKPLVDAARARAERAGMTPKDARASHAPTAPSRSIPGLLPLLTMLVAFAARGPAEATAQTPIVDDAAHAAPSRLQAGAVVLPSPLQPHIADASPGSTIVLPPGIHRGTLVVDRPLHIRADGLVILDGDHRGDVLRITAPDVTIEGLVIRGSGRSVDRDNHGVLVLAPRCTIVDNRLEDVLFGIGLQEASDSVIRNNRIQGADLHIARRGDGIRLWSSHDTTVESNHVERVRDLVVWYSDRVTIRDNTVVGSRYGLHFMYCHDNVLEENVLRNNSVGAFLMYSRQLTVRRNILATSRGPSGYGLGLKDIQGVVVAHNVFAGNRIGAYIDNPPVTLPVRDRYEGNLFVSNDIGILFQPTTRFTVFTANSLIENGQQVALTGGGELRDNHFSEDGRGNFWSDYRGVDRSGDGIGDAPYLAESLWDSLVDREPILRLFLHTPMQQAVELAARAFPVVRPRPLLSDDAPLMRPVLTALPAPPPRATGGTRVLAAVLLLLSAMALSAGRPIHPRTPLTRPRRPGATR